MPVHKCIMKEDIQEIKSDVKKLLAFKWQVVGMAILAGVVAGMVCFNVELFSMAVK